MTSDHVQSFQHQERPGRLGPTTEQEKPRCLERKRSMRGTKSRKIFSLEAPA
jgi:hypothetical protein